MSPWSSRLRDFFCYVGHTAVKRSSFSFEREANQVDRMFSCHRHLRSTSISVFEWLNRHADEGDAF